MPLIKAAEEIPEDDEMVAELDELIIMKVKMWLARDKNKNRGKDGFTWMKCPSNAPAEKICIAVFKNVERIIHYPGIVL